MFYSPYKVWTHCQPVGFGMELIGTHLNSESPLLSAAETEAAVLIPAWRRDLRDQESHSPRRIGWIESRNNQCINFRTIPRLTDARRKNVFCFTASALRGETPSDEDFEVFVRAHVSRNRRHSRGHWLLYFGRARYEDAWNNLKVKLGRLSPHQDLYLNQREERKDQFSERVVTIRCPRAFVLPLPERPAGSVTGDPILLGTGAQDESRCHGGT
jgi:hypothetical protein